MTEAVPYIVFALVIATLIANVVTAWSLHRIFRDTYGPNWLSKWWSGR